MNLKTMLARLQTATTNDERVEDAIAILAEPTYPKFQPELSPNWVVAFHGSQKSQKALDIALLMAHQTNLATTQQITIHIVYVVDPQDLKPVFQPTIKKKKLSSSIAVMDAPTCKGEDYEVKIDQADRVLWHARCLAQEWKSCFKVHLRFGKVTEEIQSVIETESASLLLMGYPQKPEISTKFAAKHSSCTVLGIVGDRVC